VLVSLRRAGPPYRLKPTDLARALLLSSGGTSNVLNRLETAGLLDRDADPEDGRGTWCRLTRAGRDLAERAVRANSAAHAAVFDPVPGPVLTAAAEALGRVVDAVDATGPVAATPRAAGRGRSTAGG
jgi:DNA-binding MarR family transcriptional regulator